MNVRIPGLLRSYTGGAEHVAVELARDGATLGDALAALDARYTGLRFRIVDEQGSVRPHIKLFVDGVLVRDLTRHVPRDGELMIVGALSGG
jgi:molybdopterin converting factor small subunit